MPSFIDLTGQRFGKLTVLSDTGQRHYGSVVWLCRCDCGKSTKATSGVLRSGKKLSCGCYKGTGNLRHGMTNTRLYRIWTGLHTRCNNKNSSSYKLYGAKGISVCKEWDSFEQFAEWATKNGYSDDLTIERLDSTKDYYPENCIWADYYTQANNRSCCVYYEKDGKSQTLSQWCRELGLNKGTVYSRIHRAGWPFERAISEPTHTEKRNKLARR